jgi:FkbM family methyltransferase
MNSKSLKILDRTFDISGEDNYLYDTGEEFEPDTVSLLRLLCDQDSRVLDIGANIGMTAIALAQLCPRGQIAAIEPVPRTFQYLRQNVSRARARNLKLFNFALGRVEGPVLMQGHPSNFACSFVADNYTIPATDHFARQVSVKRLDNIFSELSLDRLDLMKVDVEGFELEVFAGAREILHTYKPIVVLEMNHWCLNIYRRISIPEFRERLLKLFPCVYAIDGTNYLDYVDARNIHHIYYNHVLRFRYMNLVAGFDREDILSRLSGLSMGIPRLTFASANLLQERELRLHSSGSANLMPPARQ